MSDHTLLNQRYEIKEILGHGGYAATYLAVDTQTQQQCAIKCLSFKNIQEWKTWELAEREAKILKNLDHPQIPKYIDFFTIETAQDIEVYLVQEYVDGKNLAQLLKEGKHFTEEEVLWLALEIVRILEYLQQQSPPLIHRDIKPSNIILTADRRGYLIDFDSVRDTMRSVEGAGAPTIVGTYGYMPVEQTEGRAVPASDIYALGMTLIHVLAHKEPSQISKKGLRLDFRPHVQVSPAFADLLEKMIKPDWRKRYQSAPALRQRLENLLATPSVARVSAKKLARAAMLLSALVVIIFFAGTGGYYFYSASRSKPAPPPEELNPVVNAPPKMLKSAAEHFIYPWDGKISIDLYRDLTYMPTGWPKGAPVGQTPAGGLDTLPYEKLVREPPYRSKNVLYGYLPLGNGADRQITFVLDELDRPTWVVYVDKNNNEDLTDDGLPYRNEGTLKLATNVEVQIEIVTLDGEKLLQPYRLWMWVTEDQQSVRFYATCHYAGKLLLDEVVYDVIAFESFHQDGLYRENGIWIDLNQDDHLDEATEYFQHGGHVRVKQTQYQIELQYP